MNIKHHKVHNVLTQLLQNSRTDALLHILVDFDVFGREIHERERLRKLD